MISVLAGSSSGQITFFSLVWLCLLVLCGLGVSKFSDGETPIVTFALFASGFLLPLMAYRLFWIFFHRLNFLPICRNKKCRAWRYRFERKSTQGTYYRCRCGDSYLLTPDSHFKFVSLDGTMLPYRCRFEFHAQWWPDPELFEKYDKGRKKI